MTYRPASNSKTAKNICFTGAITAVILFLVSGYVSRFAFVYQITALVLAVVSVEMYMKYVGSDYVYEAADKSLKVYKVTGKKSLCVCSLDYEESLSRVISSDKYLSQKEKYPKTNFNINYAKNLSPKQYSVYFFEFNGKKSMMKFEPDKIFTDYVNEKIDNAMKNKDESVNV